MENKPMSPQTQADRAIEALAAEGIYRSPTIDS